MDYKELDVWVQARALVKSVYELSGTFPKEEQSSLTSQLRRCIVSVSSNIAEGCGRQTAKETIYFLHIARGSLFEVETQILLAKDLSLTGKDIDEILNEV